MIQLLQSAHSWDTAIFSWCLSRKRASEIAKVSRLVSHSGDGHLYVIAGILAYVYDDQFGNVFILTGLLAFAIELPLYLALKNLIKRDRPNVALAHITAFITPSDKFSFPSGHSAAAFLMAVITAHYIPALSPLCFYCASLIAISRVLLGVHYPSDILAGACLGGLSAMASITLIATT
jgi:undecaprenyl-diphosphatase